MSFPLPTVASGHTVRVKYLAPTDHKGARFSLCWEGWASDDGRTVRRVIAWAEPAKMAQEAALIFTGWLSAGGHGVFYPDRVTWGSIGPDSYVVIVQTKRQEQLDAVKGVTP
jgi:hypothetical protein